MMPITPEARLGSCPPSVAIIICCPKGPIFQSRALVIQDGMELLLLPPWLPALQQESNQASRQGLACLSTYIGLFAVVKGVQGGK